MIADGSWQKAVDDTSAPAPDEPAPQRRRVAALPAAAVAAPLGPRPALVHRPEDDVRDSSTCSTARSLLGAFWMTVQLTVLVGDRRADLGHAAGGHAGLPGAARCAGFGTAYVNIVRNTPLTVIIVFCSLGLVQTWARLRPRDSPTFIDRTTSGSPCSALIVYTSAFVCEALRSGINTVPPARPRRRGRIGLTFTPELRLIVLPQAFRAVIAPLGNVLIALTKNTTIAAAHRCRRGALLMKTMIENEARHAVPRSSWSSRSASSC